MRNEQTQEKAEASSAANGDGRLLLRAEGAWRQVERLLAARKKGQVLSYNFGRGPEQVWRKLNEQGVLKRQVKPQRHRNTTPSFRVFRGKLGRSSARGLDFRRQSIQACLAAAGQHPLMAALILAWPCKSFSTAPPEPLCGSSQYIDLEYFDPIPAVPD